MFDSTVKLKQIIHFIQQYSWKEILHSNAMQEATNSTIGAIRPCANSTVEPEHLNTVFLVRLGNQLALVVTNKVDIIRDGLSPVFIRFLTSDMVQHEFTILKLNAKIHG